MLETFKKVKPIKTGNESFTHAYQKLFLIRFGIRTKLV